MRHFRIQSGGLSRDVYAGTIKTALYRFGLRVTTKKGQSVSLLVTDLGPHKHQWGEPTEGGTFRFRGQAIRFRCVAVGCDGRKTEFRNV